MPHLRWNMDDANISPLMAVRAVVLHADDFIHGLSNLPEASCPLFVEYEIPSGCLWMERSWSWIKVSSCGEGSGFGFHPCLYMFDLFGFWLLKCALGMWKQEELKVLLLWLVLPWVPGDAEMGGSCFHHPHNSLQHWEDRTLGESGSCTLEQVEASSSWAHSRNLEGTPHQ